MKVNKFGKLYVDETGCIVISGFIFYDCSPADITDMELIVKTISDHLMVSINKGDKSSVIQVPESINVERVVIKAIEKARVS